jgi:hypothetical protein
MADHFQRAGSGSPGSAPDSDGDLVEDGPALLLAVQVYGSTFSRTVWRLYGGAKGLVMWYYLQRPDLTLEQLEALLAADDAQIQAAAPDDDGKLPLHHLCEQQADEPLLRALALRAPSALRVEDLADRSTPLRCLLAGRPRAQYGSRTFPTVASWGQFLGTELARSGAGGRVRATAAHGPGPPGAVKRPSRFPQQIGFVRSFFMGAQGA